MQVPTDDELRQMWRNAGGTFFGPVTETGAMPESELLPFLRKLVVDRDRAQDLLTQCRDIRDANL